MCGPLLRIVVLAALAGARLPAQGPDPSQTAASPTRSQIFSGWVASMNGNSVTVTRKGGGGKEAASKIFLMDAQTKVEGHLRPNARVTVRFDATVDGNRAIRIIVRG